MIIIIGRHIGKSNVLNVNSRYKPVHCTRLDLDGGGITAHREIVRLGYNVSVKNYSILSVQKISPRPAPQLPILALAYRVGVSLDTPGHSVSTTLKIPVEGDWYKLVELDHLLVPIKKDTAKIT